MPIYPPRQRGGKEGEVKKEKFRVGLQVLKTHEKRDRFHLRSIRYERPTGGLSEYEGNVVNIVVAKDGSVRFYSDDIEKWIYFYPEQVKHLRGAIKLLNRRPR
jgi:hypothetical protein